MSCKSKLSVVITVSLISVMIACAGSAKPAQPTPNQPTTNSGTPAPPASPTATTPSSTPPSPGGSSTALSALALNFSTLDVPNATQTQISSINDAGVIVGAYVDQSGNQHGFTYSDGNFKTVDVNTDTNIVRKYGTLVTGINNDGVLTGSYAVTADIPAGYLFKAFVGSDSAFETFTFGTNTVPLGINNTRVTVGGGTSGGVGNTGWIRDQYGVPRLLTDGPLPEGIRRPTDINDNGLVVGDNFFYSNGSFKYFNTPMAMGKGVFAQGLNNNGDVAGYYYVSVASNDRPISAGFVRKGDTYYSVQMPSASETLAEDINGSGVVVGTYRDGSGNNHGFVARP